MFKDDDDPNSKPEFAHKCGLCGFALHVIEVGGMIDGSFVDYSIDKATGEISIDFCNECWGRLMENAPTSMDTAIAKRRAAESYLNETPEQFASWCEDNKDTVGESSG